MTVTLSEPALAGLRRLLPEIATLRTPKPQGRGAKVDEVDGIEMGRNMEPSACEGVCSCESQKELEQQTKVEGRSRMHVHAAE